MPPQSVNLTGIPSRESFGAFPLRRTLFLSGIPTEEGVGSLRPNRNVSLTGIASAEDIGEISLVHKEYLTSINSAEHVSPLRVDAQVPPPEIPISSVIRTLSVSERFSNPIVNQNQTTNIKLSLDDEYVYQEFFLPRDYKRSPLTSQARIPPLTGFQVLTEVTQGYSDTATLEWLLERQEIGHGWEPVASGTAIGADRTGSKVWFSVYFDQPIDVLDLWLDDRFRIGIKGQPDIPDPIFKEVVAYENQAANIHSLSYDVVLREGIPQPFDVLPNLPGAFRGSDGLFYIPAPNPTDPPIEVPGTPSLLHQDPSTKRVYFSNQYGVQNFYVTEPNPFVAQSGMQNVKAFQSDGATPLKIDGEDVSLNFRVLAGVAEEGTDFLGNRFRSAVIKTDISNIAAATSPDHYWQSKPNPSKFAVESLYFDISSHGAARTVDHILLDPLTPGIYFNVYYSDEGVAGTNETEWDQKLWKHIPQIFQAKAKFSHPLPQPITTKFVKIEFSHLQPRWYAPGGFEKPILYKKFPKWVLDYYLLRLEVERVTEDPFIARRIAVAFDANALGYDYYLDDLNQAPLSSAQLGANQLSELNAFLQDRNAESDKVSIETQALIKQQFAPYQRHPVFQGKNNFILSMYGFGAASALASGERVLTPDYPVETTPTVPLPSSQVSSIRREALVVEQAMPVMSFFVDCRHKYRLVSANFKDDKAFFAGVKEIAFLRDRYTQATDTGLYIESAGDTVNTERNDFVVENGVWTTYPDTEPIVE